MSRDEEERWPLPYSKAETIGFAKGTSENQSEQSTALCSDPFSAITHKRPLLAHEKLSNLEVLHTTVQEPCPSAASNIRLRDESSRSSTAGAKTRHHDEPLRSGCTAAAPLQVCVWKIVLGGPTWL